MPFWETRLQNWASPVDGDVPELLALQCYTWGAALKAFEPFHQSYMLHVRSLLLFFVSFGPQLFENDSLSTRGKMESTAEKVELYCNSKVKLPSAELASALPERRRSLTVPFGVRQSASQSASS